MEKELEQFQQEVERLKAGRKKGALPYPEALRAFAVRYVEHTVGAGGTMSQAAKSLGVSEPTLYAWKKGERAAHRRAKEPRPKQELVAVVVGKSAGRPSETGAKPVALVSPGGWRVEGLSVAEAVEVLRRVTC